MPVHHCDVCHYDIVSVIVMCIYVRTQVVSALYCLTYLDVSCSSRNFCKFVVANTEESQREIPLHQLKPLPKHTFTHFIKTKPQVQT